MQGRSAHDEQMPDRVRPPDFSQCVYNSSDRVDDSSGQKKGPAFVRDDGPKRIRREDDDPAHQNIGEHRYDAEFASEYRIQRNADCGETPNQPEYPPSNRASKRRQAIGGIGSRDQHVDGRVVKPLEHGVCFRFQERVIESTH